MDLKSIVLSHEKYFDDKKYLFVPFEGSDRVLILLSAHNQGGKYFLLRSFLERQKYNLLFITDPDNSWYLDSDFGAKYIDLLSGVLSGFDKGKCYIFGSSMAGYAAIHFALQLNIHALVCNPQVNLNLTLDYGWYELNKNIAKLVSKKKNLALEKLLNETLYDKVMCVIHGHAPIDVANVELILGSAAPVRKLLVYTLDTDDHKMPFGRDVDKIYKALSLMDGFYDFDLQVEDQNSQMSVLRNNRKKAVKNDNIFHSRRLSSFNDEHSWAKRFEITKPGVYFFYDVGFYNSLGNISGCLLSYDGDEFSCLTNRVDSVDSSVSLGFNNEKLSDLNNGDKVFDNSWVRVPEDGELSYLGGGLFFARSGSSKNSYLNWELIKDLPLAGKEGQYISCLLDVEVEKGRVTLSLGAYGDGGYYQENKIIDSSGVYVLTFYISNILLSHKDSLFARIYFYPDNMHKKVKINKFSALSGYYPKSSFWGDYV